MKVQNASEAGHDVGVNLDALAASPPGSTILRIYPSGRMANQMIQLMFALAVKRLAKTPVTIEGYDLPEWNLSKAAPVSDAPSALTEGHSFTRASTIAAIIDRYKPPRIDFSFVMLQARNFWARKEYLDLFPLPSDEGVSTGPDDLLIHIRSGDVSTPSHPLYGPLPIGYYRYLTRTTGLQPVFMGEIEDSSYCTELRSAFPHAQFLAKGSVRGDFQTIRRAHNIAVSVSSFCWLASYLSDAQTIHVPMCGLFDLRQDPENDLLPADDPRYLFHEVPPAAWRNRYFDFKAEQGKFRVWPDFHRRRCHLHASVRLSVRRARVRFAIESRMALDAVKQFLKKRTG